MCPGTGFATNTPPSGDTCLVCWFPQLCIINQLSIGFYNTYLLGWPSGECSWLEKIGVPESKDHQTLSVPTEVCNADWGVLIIHTAVTYRLKVYMCICYVHHSWPWEPFLHRKLSQISVAPGVNCLLMWNQMLREYWKSGKSLRANQLNVGMANCFACINAQVASVARAAATSDTGIGTSIVGGNLHINQQSIELLSIYGSCLKLTCRVIVMEAGLIVRVSHSFLTSVNLGLSW